MSRTMINFVLDLFLLSITVSLLFTTAVVRFVFPVPTAADGWTLWGGDYNAWANLQFIFVAIIGLAVLVHVAMHWSWVAGVVVTRVLRRPAREARPDTGIQTVWGVSVLIVIVNLLGLLIGAAYLMIEAPVGS